MRDFFLSSNLTPLIEISDIWCDKQICSSENMSVKLEGMPTKLATADSFTGKKVIDREGIGYGKVKHIHINQDTLTVCGVTIHQGFRKDYFLSEDYIDKFSEETLLLSRPPIRTGISVVDIDGHKIGKVKRLQKDLDTNELESIEVSDGLMHSKILSKSEIWGVGEKVILRMTKKEFKDFE
jgi:sporulation protein YlmC with PRC-barrel domain